MHEVKTISLIGQGKGPDGSHVKLCALFSRAEFMTGYTPSGQTILFEPYYCKLMNDGCTNPTILGTPALKGRALPHVRR